MSVTILSFPVIIPGAVRGFPGRTHRPRSRSFCRAYETNRCGPRQWRDPTVVERRRARGRGYGHGVIKNSLPLAAEVASGNLHLIPGGPLCQPASQPASHQVAASTRKKGWKARNARGFAVSLGCAAVLPVGPFSLCGSGSAGVASAIQAKKKTKRKKKILHPITRGI